jgi:hypothetical protein
MRIQKPSLEIVYNRETHFHYLLFHSVVVVESTEVVCSLTDVVTTGAAVVALSVVTTSGFSFVGIGRGTLPVKRRVNYKF